MTHSRSWFLSGSIPFKHQRRKNVGRSIEIDPEWCWAKARLCLRWKIWKLRVRAKPASSPKSLVTEFRLTIITSPSLIRLEADHDGRWNKQIGRASCRERVT